MNWIATKGWSIRILSGLVVQFAVAGLLCGQQSASPAQRNLARLPGIQMSQHRSTGQCDFVRLDPLSLSGTTLQERALNFAHAFGAAFGYQPSEHTLIYIGTSDDLTGGQHLHFKQRWRELPTVGGEMRFHFDASGRLTAVNGLLLPAEPLASEPELTPTTAIALAQQYFAYLHPEAQMVESTTPPRLVLFRSGLLQMARGRNHLAYEVALQTDTGAAARVYIDAHSGAVLEKHSRVYPALDRRLYRRSWAGNNLLWTEGDPLPGNLLPKQQEILTVTEQFYQFLFATFDIDSYDNNGAVLRAVYDPTSLNCDSNDNATWGGGTVNLCLRVISDDVIAHEWAHALTEATCDLIYAHQPGALSESFSDIMGEVVDLLNGDSGTTGNTSSPIDCEDITSTRWRIGEDTDAFAPFLRDMRDPTCQGDPGKVSDPEYFCGAQDDGGVHSNSGINNHAFVLLVDGGSYNGVTVPALGLTKATHLFYLAHTQYLTRYSNFSNQADALEAAAAQLIAAGTDLPALTVHSSTTLSGVTFTAADSTAVATAIAAVELRSAPSCPNRTPLFTPVETGPCGASSFQAFFSEDFEMGSTGWVSEEHPQYPTTWDSRDWTRVDQLPHSRDGYALFAPTPHDAGNCISDLEAGIVRLISPPITVPPGTASGLRLTFDQVVSLDTKLDGGRLLLSRDDGTTWAAIPQEAFLANGYTATLNSSSGNPYGQRWAFTGADEGAFSSAWATTQVDLSGLGLADGSDFRLAWDLATDNCGGWSGWWIDNVRVGSCTAALPVTWLSFTAFAEREHIELRWATAREVDNAGFWVERFIPELPDAEWENLGWVPATGTTETITDYTFFDRTPPAGIWCYYRLRQVDIDGTTDFSPVIKARLSQDPTDWRVFPNPAVGPYLYLRPPGDKAAETNVIIYDVTGRIVSRQTNVVERIEISSLPPGVYYLSISMANEPPVVKRFLR